MTITLYDACDSLICTTLFLQPESTQLTLFKDLDEKIFEGKVTEN